MLRDELQHRLKGKVLLIGIGNPLRGDDASGPALIEMLADRVSAGLLDAGEVPESYVGRILAARADTIVVVDAADFGAEAGDVAVLEIENLAGCAISTHQMPLGVLLRHIAEKSRADLFALGVQAAHIDFGEPPSPEVMGSLRDLAELFMELLPRETLPYSHAFIEPKQVSL